MQEIFNNINITSLELFNFKNEKIDILKIFLKIDIFESIFEYFLTGKILISDTQDLIANFPIIGNETLKISLEYNAKTVDLNFRVYKIERDLNNTKGIQKSKNFHLYFCSKEKLKSTKLSRKYSDKPENIIQYLITEHLGSSKTFNSETTLEEIDVFSNFWSFKKIVDYIRKISRSEEYFDYIFFETLEDLNFKSISYLLNKSKVEELFFDISDDNILKNDNIKIFRFDKYFNILENQSLSMFGKTLYRYHDTDYSYTKTKKDLDDVYKKIVSLGKNIPFDKNLFDGSERIENNFYDPDISLYRTISMILLNQYNIALKVNGTLDRKSGQIIKIKYPNVYNDEIVQKSFDGNWFIMGIHHIISNTGFFEQNLLLSKNSKFDFPNLEETTNRNL